MYCFQRLTAYIAIKNGATRMAQAFDCLSRYKSSNIMKHPPWATSDTDTTIPRGILGQPTCHTHPHLIPQGNLTSGITQREYMERRDNFISKLSGDRPNDNLSHIAVIPGACKQYMSDNIPYPFRQNSDFFYLTGCLEPNAVLVMTKPPGSSYYKSILFMDDKDSHVEQWEGPRTGCIEAVRLFNVNEARPIENFQSFINKFTSTQRSLLWYRNKYPINRSVHDVINSIITSTATNMGDPEPTLHHMRVFKSPAEIKLMKATCAIGAAAINTAMACTEPGMSEHNIHSLLEYTCRQAGAEHLSFPPVVAGGARATHIHYITNNQVLTNQDLLLVDSGSQRWLYNSDISRTWPVSGRFSKYQRILYEIVLSVQKRLIEILAEQRPPLDQLFDQMCRLLGMRLQQEGILARSLDSNELIARAYRLCPHHVSHYLGLDVHDSPSVGRMIPVMANMVVTVEPGVYIRSDDTTVRPEFRGVGIRIEDDVLITDGAPVVLTNACIKEPDQIESLVGSQMITYNMDT